MLGDYIVVKYSIDKLYVIGTLFYLSLLIYFSASFYLNKDFFNHVKSIYLRFTYIGLSYLFTILLLWFFGLIILVNFHFAIGGSH
jgi:hypothetical protein